MANCPTCKQPLPRTDGLRFDVKRVMQELLMAGPVEARTAKAVIRARCKGGSETTLRAARVELGVKVRHEGFGPDGQWIWSLPA